MEFWFSEFHTPDVKHSIRVNKQLYSKQSDYQRIDIFETPEFGRVLTLDGNVMLTERDEYDIQIEFGDIGNILAYLSLGDRPQEVERLVSALAEIKRRYRTDGSGLLSQEYIDPVVAASPQEAFYAP